MEKENRMGTMPVTGLLMRMSWPAVVSMLITALYNVVDSIFVAQISEDSLAALTLVNPFQILTIAVGVGTGVGANSLIARRLGAKKQRDAEIAAANGVKLALITGVIFGLVGLLAADAYMSLFTTNEAIFLQGKSYLMIVSGFSVFLISQIVIEKIIQSTGNMILPMISSTIGAAINIILDPILIFGLLGFPKMGIVGAAIATVIAQGIALTAGIIILLKKDIFIKVNIREKLRMETIRGIYAVGIPTMMAQAVVSLLVFALNSVLVSYSSTAVAVFGAYIRLQSFITMPVFGINQGAMPVYGYNYGARDMKRLKESLKVSLIMAVSLMSMGFLVMQLFPHQLLSLFNATEDMHVIGVPAFRTISICLIPSALGIISVGFFAATGHGIFSLFGTVLRQIMVIIPAAWILGKIGGVQLLWWAFPMAEVVGIIYALLMLRYIYKKEAPKMNMERID